MLSAAQRKEFDERGIVRLARAAPSRIVTALREEVLALVAARRLAPAAPSPGFAVTPSKTASVPNAHGFEEVWGPVVTAVLDQILGADGWRMPKHAGQLLAIAYPDRGAAWELPHKTWHLDYSAPGSARGIPGLQLFLCVDRVEPRSGATLVAAGTPRRIEAIRRREGSGWPGRSADVREALRSELPWFRELCTLRPGEDRVARFMDAATVCDGEAFQVVELTGEPGDVWAMHPWMIHNLSPNCGARPRLALTERIHAQRRPW